MKSLEALAKRKVKLLWKKIWIKDNQEPYLR